VLFTGKMKNDANICLCVWITYRAWMSCNFCTLPED
jgi:hypothetical protein